LNRGSVLKMSLEKLKNSYRYGAYQALLEEKITRNEYEMLVEAGGIIDKLVSKVKGFFGGIGPGSEAFKKASSSKAFSSYLPQAQKGLKDIVDSLRKYAGSVEGIDVEQVVNETLMGLLNSVGTTPKEIDDAEKSAKSGESGGESSAGTGAESGTTISTATINSNPAAAAALVADATGKPEEAVAAELEKKKPDIAALSSVLGNAIGNLTSVDGNVATKVVKALIDKGHLKLENGNSLTRRSLMNFVNEVNELNNQYNLMERWSQLAGIHESLLVERDADTAAFDELMKMIDSGEVKTTEALNQWLQGPKGQKAGLTKAMKKQLIAAFEKKNTKEDKKEVEKIVSDAPEAKEVPGQKEASPEGEKKTEEVKKEFGPAFKDVRAVIKPEEADDDTLAKVIDTIDKFKSVKIAA